MRPAAAILACLAFQDSKALNDPASPEANRRAPAEFRAKLETSKGEIFIKVVRDWAPIGADRFYNLVKAGFYDDTRFYRVLPKFVAQWGYHGDPKVTAKWRAAAIDDDPVKKKNLRGTVVFAKAGPNSRTTSVFINLKDNASLDSSGFAPFGEVVQGLDLADALHSGYGDGPPKGRGPVQKRIVEEGNAYLDKDFKDLDRITKATLIE
jgi:peptidyl-prolyl cis-trans isomerase A (cyclophilin A)